MALPLTLLTAQLLMPLAALHAAAAQPLVPASSVNVADFGALPDDGKDDTLAIDAAIQAAQRLKKTEIRFAAGTYQLTRTVTGGMTRKDCYIRVQDAENLAFVGATTRQVSRRRDSSATAPWITR